MTDPTISSTGRSPAHDRPAFYVLNTRTLFVVLYAASLFLIAVRPTLDPDMWWHLRTGEYILQQGIPHHDVFSYTVVDHRWITHEWLSEVVMWLIYSSGGFPALILSFAAVIAVSFWLIYLISEGRPYLASFVGLLSAFASAPLWGARPQMFNILFLALFLFLVEKVRRGSLTVRAFWWFPILTVLWANLHSGYLTGIALLALYCFGDAAQCLLRRWLPSIGSGLTLRQAGTLALATGGSLFAAALNPNTFRLWAYPFETLGSPSMQQFIQEWQPPDFRLHIFWPFVALLLLGVMGWLFGKRPGLTEILLFLGTGAAGMVSVRNIPLFAVVAAPIVSRALCSLIAGAGAQDAKGHRDARENPARLLFLNAALVGVFFLAGALWVGRTVAGNEEAIRQRYPVAAVDFLQAQGLASARGYNDYGWGGYLIWRGISVFVDGRADVYGDDFLFFYQQTAQLQPNWREPLDQFAVDYVLVQRRSPLATMLSEVDGWREAYSDDMARIFVRSR